MLKLFLFIAILFSAQGCDDQQAQQNFPTQKEVNKSMEEVNRKFMLDEAMMIDSYIKRRKLKMEATGTGLRYAIEKNGSGLLAKEGQRAHVAYIISLLDGTQVYNSELDGVKDFLIGQDQVESGLHEGILLMRVGDKAKFILPSHLAHGLRGDNSKIPPRSSVVYDITLLKLTQ